MQTYAGGDRIAHVWLMGSDGAARFCLMSGEVAHERADELADWFAALGVEVEVTRCPLPGTSVYKKATIKVEQPLVDCSK